MRVDQFIWQLYSDRMLQDYPMVCQRSKFWLSVTSLISLKWSSGIDQTEYYAIVRSEIVRATVM